MKIWFDNRDINYNEFVSEQFLITPFLDLGIIKQNKDFKKSEEWISSISKIIYRSSLEECDVLIYPKKLDQGISKYINLAEKYNKKILCFYNDDNIKPTCLPDCVDVYRTSFYSSNRKNNEFSMPAWSSDLYIEENIRSKNSVPIVGFCGAITHISRAETIKKIQQSDLIDNFIIRDSFWGGNIHNDLIRKEYIDNIISSDLILCCRGAGNFSFRLYEVLSLGRIPIIVDCDTPLPCSDIVQWDWFIKTTQESIIEDIYSFWEKVSFQEYHMLQLYAREVYREVISPSGFAQYINSKYSV